MAAAPDVQASRSADGAPVVPPVGRLGRLLARYEAAVSTERRLIGLSLLRIAVAGVLLLYLLGQWPDRRLIWGPDGIYPASLYQREFGGAGGPALFASDSLLLFEAFYHLGIVVSVLYLLGWRTVTVGVAFYVVAWSLLRRTPLLMTGGDSLLLLSLPWMLLANTSAYLSADSGWRLPWSRWRPGPRPWRALLHNVAVLALLLQLSTMYLFAGVHKLFGAPWLDGSATGSVLRVERFTHPLLGPLIYEHQWLGQGLTFWTLLFELTAPVLLWLPALRWLVTVQSVLFHGGIGLLMGLVFFALEATMLQLAVFPDESYRRLAARLHLQEKSVADS